MRTLILMRHAKSDWSTGSSSDHERPLNARGRKAAPEAGAYLNALGWHPDVIVHSTALRAEETAELMAAAVHYTGETIAREVLYSGVPDDYLDVIRSISPRIERALIIGHNPLMEETVALLLTGRTNGLRVVMTTAAMVCVAFPDEWDRITAGSGVLRWMRIPRLSED